MKKILSLLCMFCFTTGAFAQNNVGIGTTNPRNSAILDLYSTTQGLLLPRVDTTYVTGLVAADHGLIVYDTVLGQPFVWNGTKFEPTAGEPPLWTPSGSDIYYSLGSVGIGTNNPEEVLHISQRNDVTNGTDGTFINLQNSTIFGGPGQLAGIRFRADGTNLGVNNRYKGGLLFQRTGAFGVGSLILATNSAADNTSITAADAKMIVLSTGNVGIGTTTPANKLEVVGNAAKFDSVIIANNAQVGYVLTAADATGAASWQAPVTSPWTLNATDVFYTAGNVGIGINSPSARLHVNQTIIGAGAQQVISNTSNATNASSGLAFTNSAPAQGYMIGIDNTSGIFKISNSSVNINAFNRLQIDPLGNVGIGNFVGVLSRLDVDGQITMRAGAISGFVPVSNANGTMTWTNPNALGPWTKTGSNIYQTVLSDNVGIGTNNPGTLRLNIVDAGNANLYNGTFGVFANNLTQGVGIGYAGIQAIGSNLSQDLFLNAKGTGNISMQVSGTTGNVRIGNPVSTAKLAVQGNISADEYVLNANGSGPVPEGGIIMWSGSPAAIPAGYVLCNGGVYLDKSGVPRATPDLRGRFIVGYNPANATIPTNATNKEINYGAIGNTGGTNAHVLSVNEMPSHNHTGSTSFTGSHTHTGTTDIAGNHAHNYGFYTGVGGNAPAGIGGGFNNGSTNVAGNHTHTFTTAASGNHSHTFTSNATGGGLSHENRPAYFVLAFIMKKY